MYELLCDGKSQAESFFSLSILQTGKFLENLRLFFGRDASSGVAHGERQDVFSPRNVQGDMPFGSELQGVRQEVLRDLSDAERVAYEGGIQCLVALEV